MILHLILLMFQIDYYEDLYKELEKIEDQKVFDNWLKVDVRPFKQALLNTVCKWGNMFKQHLVAEVNNRYIYPSFYSYHKLLNFTFIYGFISLGSLLYFLRALIQLFYCIIERNILSYWFRSTNHKDE